MASRAAAKAKSANERLHELEDFVREVALYGEEPGAIQVLIDVARSLAEHRPARREGRRITRRLRGVG